MGTVFRYLFRFVFLANLILASMRDDKYGVIVTLLGMIALELMNICDVLWRRLPKDPSP